MPYVPSNGRFISTYRRYKIPAGPEMLTHEVTLSFPVYSSQMYRTFPLDISHHLRHRMLRRDRDPHRHVIRPQMTLFYPTLFLTGQLPEHFAQMAT